MTSSVTPAAPKAPATTTAVTDSGRIIQFTPDITVNPSNATAVDLSTCSVEEYLSRTVYPLLQPALSIIDTVRPADPIEYLALILYESSNTNRAATIELEQLESIKSALKQQLTAEYSLPGRV